MEFNFQNFLKKGQMEKILIFKNLEKKSFSKLKYWKKNHIFLQKN